MKYFLKGILFGITLVIVQKLCCVLVSDFSTTETMITSSLIFFIVSTAFLTSNMVAELLLCGCAGLFSMFWVEIIWLFNFEHVFSGISWLDVYVGGFFGSMAAIVVSVILTVKNISFSELFKEVHKMTLENNTKIKLIIYALISAAGFSYFCMPENAGISVPLFIITEFLCLLFIIPDRKRLLYFIPMFIISLNSFISASTVWRVSNFFVIAFLFIAMFSDFNLKKDSPAFLIKLLEGVFIPFTYLSLPVKWLTEIKGSNTPVLKRIFIGLAISIPCAVILIVVLANADAVFSIKTENLISRLLKDINFHSIYIILCGILAGGFLFGTACRSFSSDIKPEKPEKIINGDIIIINIFLTTILFVYTLFVIIQFKYLFAGATLPQGLTFTDYARKGFFELLALTGVNIIVILTVVKITKNYSGKWDILTKSLCHYLTFVTVILLISSFYRMLLYTNSDGLTRLRFYVLVFLIFEFAGLVVTFFYIAKPKFNIILIYIVIALSCYTVLNILPADNIIAKNQIELYLNNERDDLDYIFTLSPDAAPAMKELYNATDDEELKNKVLTFMSDNTSENIPKRWQRYNLSIQYAHK